MSDLTAFLGARLDEDERELEKDPPRGLGYANLGARIWREIEAKRRIVKAHDLAEHYCPLPVLAGRHGQLWTPEEGPCWTLRLLAAVYIEHPDYDPGWAP